MDSDLKTSRAAAGSAQATIQRPAPPPSKPREPQPRSQPEPHAANEHELPTDLRRPNPLTIIAAVLIFIAVLAGLFFIGWRPHERAAEQARNDAAEQASMVPIVSVAKPIPTKSVQDLTWPCDVRANQDTALYTRANGFLKKLYVDIGSRVKKDDLLAEIDTPDVDAQVEQSKAAVQQAVANVAKAEADLNLAQRTFSRYEDLQRRGDNSVTQQEVDQQKDTLQEAVATKQQAIANQKAAEATLQQFQVTQSFEKIVAPFNGVITARIYDVGALLSPTNTGPGKEIFRIAQTDPMRVFVSVPQVYSTTVKDGEPGSLEVRNYPGRTFEGTVVRKTDAIDPNTRVMSFEVDFPNADDALVTGMYGNLRLGISEAHPVLIIPTSALIFDANGTRVAVVQDGKVRFQPVKVGQDMGTQMEITDGLSKDDEIVAAPGEMLTEGSAVQIAEAAPASPPPGPTTAPIATNH